MTTALLYFLTAAACVALAHRFVLRRSWRARTAMVLLPLAFTGRALLTGRVYAPIEMPYNWEPLKSMRAALGVGPSHNEVLSDVYCLNIPWKHATRLAWTGGQWPLWNPFNFCGDILAASAQPTPYDPLTLLSLLLPAANALTYLAAMTFLLAALSMFVFLRDLGCSEPAALLGAAGWAFSMFLVIWVGWVIGPTALWLPLVLAGVRRIVRLRGMGDAALLAVAFTMMLLAGHPESAMHIVAIGLVWAAAELWAARLRGRELARAAALGLGAGVVALGLCSIYLLPILDAIPQTMEGAYRRVVWPHERRSVPAAVALGHLESQLIPFRFGDPSQADGGWAKGPAYNYTDAAYCGSLLFPLALFGLWRSRWRGRWLVLAIGIGGLAIGIELAPFADWIALLPGFRLALNARMIMTFAFAVPALAALGLDAAAKDRRGLLAVSIASTIGMAILLATVWRPMLALGLSPEFLRTRSALLIAPLVLVIVAIVSRLPHAAMAWTIVALLVAQRAGESADFYPTNPARIFYPRIAVLDRLPRGGEPYRVTAMGYVFVPNIATMYGVEDVRGYQALTLERMRNAQDLFSVPQPVWFNRIDDLTRPFLSAMNVRYALAPAGTATPVGWRHVDAQPGVEVFENLRVLPRAFLPRRVVITGADPQAEMAREKDFGERGWIEVQGAERTEIENAQGAVSVKPRTYNRLAIDATLDGDGWLIVSQSAWKGWKAKVDGRPTRLHIADGVLLGFKLTRGRHRIQLRYLPDSFLQGAAISGITVLLLLLALLERGRLAHMR